MKSGISSEQENQSTFGGIFCDNELCGVCCIDGSNWGSIFTDKKTRDIPDHVILRLVTATLAAAPVGRTLTLLRGERAEIDIVNRFISERCGIDAKVDVDTYFFKSLDVEGQEQIVDTVRLPIDEELPLLLDWRMDYLEEVGACGHREAARNRLRALQQSGDHYVLDSSDGPVAYLMFYTHDDVVNFSSVYVPPRHRGQGLSKQLVRGALALLTRRGFREARLTAENPVALRTYLGVGFQMTDQQLCFSNYSSHVTQAMINDD